MGLHLEKAFDYVDNDDFENAIEECKIGIQNSDFECALELGIIYSELLDEINITKAIDSFQIGAMNGHKECQKELGIILLSNQNFKNYPMAIKWLLSSKYYEESTKVNELLKAIEIIYKNTDLNSIDDLKSTISIFNEYISLTRNKIILTPVYTYRNDLVCICGELAIKCSKTIYELKENYNYFLKYKDNDFFYDILIRFGTKEVILFLKSCNDVNEAENYLLSLDNKNYEYDIHSRGLICLWLARSYFGGLNNAIKNIDLSIKYYMKVKNPIADYELEKIMIHYCQNLIKVSDFDSARKYLKYIKSYSESAKIVNLIEEHDKKLYFEKISFNASTGDVKAMLELAKLYENGLGTSIDHKKALTIHQELYKKHKSTESFDYLFDYYKMNNKNDLLLLLKNAKKYNLRFNTQQDETYRLLLAHYATNYYDVVYTKELTSVDIDSNIIYYMFDYYKKWWMEKYPNNQFYKDNFFSFIAIKKRNYNANRNKLNFPGSLFNFFSLFKGDWIICSVPGHEKTTNISNGISDIVNSVHLKSNFVLKNELIQRTYTVEKKATASCGRSNDYRIDIKSLTIEYGFNVKGKNIIVIDDITTSGSTLIACKNLLMDAGAAHVVLVALGKTKEPEYGY